MRVMFEFDVVKTNVYDHWFKRLRDRQAKVRIAQRVRRLILGNPGQYRVLKGGVCELKIDYGPGYRVYYTQRGATLLLLLCGGDKSSQHDDIEEALRIAKLWKDTPHD